MSKKADETIIYLWRRLSFPLWNEPRPQFELFNHVNIILSQKVPFTIRSNFEELKESGDRKAWLYWEFDGPINEERRGKLQKLLDDIYGDEAAGHFCWDGASAKTTICEARAIGKHVQGAG